MPLHSRDRRTPFPALPEPHHNNTARGCLSSGSLEADPEVGIFVGWAFRSGMKQVGQSRGRKLIHDVSGLETGLLLISRGPLKCELHH